MKHFSRAQHIVRAAWFGALLAASIAAHPSVAQAQAASSTTATVPPREVTERRLKELIRTGFAEYKKGNYEAAREAYAEAWEIRELSEVAAALADLEMRLGRYSEAAPHWEFYLKSDPPDKDDALAQLAECRKRVSKVSITVQGDAELSVDGYPIPGTERRGGLTLAQVWLRPGAHLVEARAVSPERRSKVVDVQVALGRDQDVPIDLHAPVVAAKPSPARPAKQASRHHVRIADSAGVEPRTIVAISGATLTLIGAGVGAWLRSKADSADNQRQQMVDKFRTENPGILCGVPDQAAICVDILAKAKEHDRNANLATGIFIGAGVVGVATIATYLLWPVSEDATVEKAFTVAPFVGLGAQGVRVAGAF